MKLAFSSDTYETEGFGQANAPGIHDENKAVVFHIMTTGLYSRPQESMFRELCANALDEAPHAGGVPFEVMIPSRMSPNLVITDNGRGMSHAFMMRDAMSLGASTKRGDNLMQGGFGLGLKTPFVLCDQFTIKIFRGDHAQTYVIDKHEGTPRVLTDDTMREPLDTPRTGTQITVPVPQNDVHVWRGIAEKILAYFPPGSFTCYGANVTPRTLLKETEHYATCESQRSTYAMLGAIAYELDFGAIYGEGWRDQKHPVQGVELRFPIGSLDLLPSREGLRYTERTRRAIIDALKGARRDFIAEASAAIQAAPTLWAAQRAFCDVKAKGGMLANLIGADVSWHGWKVQGLEIPRPVRVYSASALALKSPKPESDGNAHLQVCPRLWGAHPFNGVHIMIDDVDGRMMVLRAKAWRERHAHTPMSRLVIVPPETVERLGIEGVPMYKASDYSPPPAQVRRAKIMLRAYKVRQHERNAVCSVPLAQGGFYVRFKGSEAPAHAKPLAALPWFAGALYGLSGRWLDEAQTSGDIAAWTDAGEHVKARVAAMLASKPMVAHLAWRDWWSRAKPDVQRQVRFLLETDHTDPAYRMAAAYIRKQAHTLPDGFTQDDAKAFEALTRAADAYASLSNVLGLGLATYKHTSPGPHVLAALENLANKRPLWPHVFPLLDASKGDERRTLWRALEVKGAANIGKDQTQ